VIGRRSFVAIVSVCGVLAAPTARAQDGPTRYEAAGGVRWTGGIALGGRDAAETASTGGSFLLFSSDTRLSGVPAVEARFGVRLTMSAQVVVEAAFARPRMRTVVRDDREGARGIVASERLTQYSAGGGLVWRVNRWQFAEGVVPFVSAGGAYLRELHEGEVLVEGGAAYYVGGGLDYLLRRPGADPWGRGLGVRTDVRLSMRRDGVAFDRRYRGAPTLGATLFVRF
jgi:hypothetical protein